MIPAGEENTFKGPVFIFADQAIKNCNQTQIWLSTALGDNTREAGADVKESGFIQVLATWKMGDSYLKIQLSISGIL